MGQIAVVTVVTVIKDSYVTRRRGRVSRDVGLDMMGYTATKHAQEYTTGPIATYFAIVLATSIDVTMETVDRKMKKMAREEIKAET